MRISALDRKLLRDLWHIRGQGLAIALVIAAGVGIYVLMHSTLFSLDLTLRTYYDRYRFGEVFATCKRAPLSLGDRIRALPGVAQAELRVSADVTVEIEGSSEPLVGRFVSIPGDRRPALNDLFIRTGRYLEPGRPGEVLVSEKFAAANRLQPGSQVSALLNGRRQTLRVVGIALSPEFIYPIRPGDLLPDDARFGIFWMERRQLAAAFDMEGGFNDVTIRLLRGASEREVIASVDQLLRPYGAPGAIPRALQTSHWFLANELYQLRSMGLYIPVVFLGVAAFLLNIVLSRIVTVQREQIAALKAVGYSNAAVAFHYIKWSLAIALIGATLGIGIGAWLGRSMTLLYADFFNFPLLIYRLDTVTTVLAAAIGVAAAIAGAVTSVRRVVVLPPAEAMRPEAPAPYRVSLIERTGLGRLMSQPTRIILRNLQRHPGRTLLSVVGIALGGALLVVGNFSLDSMNVIIDTQFNLAARYDVLVSFVEPVSARAVYEAARFPGVLDVEPIRVVPARLVHGHRTRNVAIQGLTAGARLNRAVDARQRLIDPPLEGLLMSRVLASALGVECGDVVDVEVLEGQRPVYQVRVGRLIDDFMGMNVYLDQDRLHRLLHEGPTLTGAALRVDPARLPSLILHLKTVPAVMTVVRKKAAVESFERTVAEMMGITRAIEVIFAAIIAFGVVYNTARISLAERSRELATLRVIGFTRGEISYILLGELGFVAVVAVPLGLATGYGLSALMVLAFETELYRLPLVISNHTYVFAAVTIVAATAVSALIVRTRLDRLDLVQVLKTRE